GQIAAFFLAIIMFIGIWGIPTFAAADSKAEAFKDVPESAWYHGYVMMLADKGIVRGFGTTGEFRPLNKLTRGQAAKMLAIAAGLPYEGKHASICGARHLSY
ncbi:MAG: S-layer homology domain-containing protein, partial [Clostridiaceae bacterium]|nr:S-layer homology domain-containing protein [Clostridiaceae bacterium]